ncbi:hemicentin-2 isoform X13 [Acanthochromis polyacanthus]|uniref:hemicentin-2 isoform X13 n=1 Tax=Acanthochromis polyacanthus TaxID=80966 RepID=UPI0022348D10|nr:hemicentin-2 isoform X13 [Acanthochromis polyacanthus]
MLPLRMLGIGLLMLSLCDADTACPEKLSLDPPEIIEEYGTEVFVNCTSTVEHDGMYWIVRNKSFHIELEENFISQSVLLSDWDVTAECKIMLNESHECSKELEMTIYKNPEVIHSIKRVRPTPKETQYDLDCDTINVAPVQNLTVKWYKNDELLDTNFFKDKTKTPVNVSSPLLITVNRGEEVQMRCEAQLNFVTHGLQLPVISQTFNLSAQYPPELNPEEETESIFVLQDDDITLNCPAEGNPPPVFRWTYDGMTMAESSNTLKVTHINASATYTCTASNYLGNTTKQIHIHVKQGEAAPATLPPAEPATPEAEDCPLMVTPSEIVVRFGDPASVNCSTSATNAVGMGWESPVGGTGFEHPPVVTWMVEKLEDWTAAPLCYITLDTTTGAEQCDKSPTVTLYKTPDTVSVSAVHPGPMVEGTNFYLKCDISNVAPVQKLKVKWYRDNETVSGEMFLDTNKTPQNVFSTHIITPERDYDGSQYRCEAELHLGPNGPDFIPTETSEPYTAIVHYAPQFREGNSVKEMNLGENVILECIAEGNPAPFIHWNLSSAANLKETTVGRQKIITITRATSTNAGVYICVATNEVGTVTRSVTLVMKGSSAWHSMAVIWRLLIAGIILFILIAMVLLHNHLKNHGQYSFVPANTKDGSNVPMTTLSEGGTA